MIIANSPKISSTKIKVVAMMLLILVSSIWFALHSHPEMRRESDRAIPVQGVIVLSLDQALDLSLAYGDYREVKVDWSEVA